MGGKAPIQQPPATNPESEKKLDDNEITDKERYLLSYKLETLRTINQ